MFAAFLVGFYAAWTQKQIDFNTYFIAGLVSFVGFVYYIFRYHNEFKVQIQYVDSLIKRLDDNKTVGTLEEIFQNVPKHS